MKTCPNCKITKHLSDFYSDAGRRDGRSSRCKTCVREMYRKRWAAQRAIWRKSERGRKSAFKRSFAVQGITEADYYTKCVAQNFKCAICGKGAPAGQRLFIDHDHTHCPTMPACGKCIRGLLCMVCNTGIGLLKTADNCTRAASYLARYKGPA